MINLLRWCIRVAWLAALILGLLLWGGRLAGSLNLHMILGGIVALGLVILAVSAFLASVRIALAVISIVWAAVTVYVGLTQTRWMPGGSHWIIETVHLLLGIGAIGIAEALAGAIVRGRKSPG
ncbi:MAG: hypothetical protein ABSG41_16845 [Bryobacteraceae bacterium]|jgi:hypothetical protein